MAPGRPDTYRAAATVREQPNAGQAFDGRTASSRARLGYRLRRTPQGRIDWWVPCSRLREHVFGSPDAHGGASLGHGTRNP